MNSPRSTKQSSRSSWAGTDSIQALHAWYETSAGSQFHEAEIEAIDEALANLFGYHLLQVGCPSNRDLLSSTRIRHVIRMVSKAERLGAFSMAGLVGQPERVPVLSDSIDVVLLPHTLDLSNDAHSVLREVDRILIPEGHVVIVGFNPWSAWGFKQLLRGRRRRERDGLHARSALRIQDWLALLGIETCVVRHFFFRPPLAHDGLMNRMTFFERFGRRFFPKLGSAYILVAKKRVTTLSVIKPRWRRARPMLGDGVNAKPAGRMGRIRS